MRCKISKLMTAEPHSEGGTNCEDHTADSKRVIMQRMEGLMRGLTAKSSEKAASSVHVSIAVK